MGLDMYLYKAKRMNGYSAKDYEKIEDYIENNVDSQDDLIGLNLEVVTNIPNSNELISSIKQRGEYIQWFSIMDKIGYWRKANHIHAWFVDNVQDGIDRCQLSIVSKAQLEKLLEITKKVKKNKNKAKELLPTQDGFFFGNTDYNEYYDDDNRETIDILTQILSSTDFENEIVFYRSSW